MILVPLVCTTGIKKLLGLQPDIPALQLPFAPSTTVGQLFLNPFGFETKEMKMPGIFPKMPRATPPKNFKNNTLLPPASQIFKDAEYSDIRPPAIEPLPPAYGREFTADPSPSPFNYYSTTPYVKPPAFVTMGPEPTTVPPDYENERNIEPQIPQSTGGGGTYMSNELSQENSVISHGSFVNYETTLPPTTLPGYYGTPYMLVDFLPLNCQNLLFQGCFVRPTQRSFDLE